MRRANLSDMMSFTRNGQSLSSTCTELQHIESALTLFIDPIQINMTHIIDLETVRTSERIQSSPIIRHCLTETHHKRDGITLAVFQSSERTGGKVMRPWVAARVGYHAQSSSAILYREVVEHSALELRKIMTPASNLSGLPVHLISLIDSCWPTLTDINSIVMSQFSGW